MTRKQTRVERSDMTAGHIKTSQQRCVRGAYVCVNEEQVWMIDQSQVWGKMWNGVRMATD